MRHFYFICWENMGKFVSNESWYLNIFTDDFRMAKVFKTRSSAKAGITRLKAQSRLREKSLIVCRATCVLDAEEAAE